MDRPTSLSRGPSQPTQPTAEPAQWLERHGDALFRFALLRVGSAAAAEDLVQEALLAALAARHGFGGRSEERTWLIGILRHKILNHVRAAARQANPDDRTAAEPRADEFDERGKWRVGPAQWGGEPSRALEQREFWDAFSRCVSQLPPPMAHAFCLREVEGLECGEIGKILGVSATNLWTMLHRARTRLRRCLEARWFGRKGD